MINTLPTWKSQHAATTLSHNDVVRLLGDANEEIERLQAELTRVKVHKALHNAMMDFADEQGRLRDALQFIANHEAPEGSALETMVRFAKLAIEVKG